jgi:hypothetical protein
MSLMQIGKDPLAFNTDQSFSAPKYLINPRILRAVEQFENRTVDFLVPRFVLVKQARENQFRVLPVAKMPGGVTDPRRDATTYQGMPGKKASRSAPPEIAVRLALFADYAIIAHKHRLTVTGRLRVDWTPIMRVAMRALVAVAAQPGFDHLIIKLATQ